MTELEILTVTYAPDFELFKDLHASVAKFTDDQVIHRVVVDDADRALFERFHSDRCQVLCVSETLPKTFVKVPRKSLMINLRNPWPPMRGWIFQQLVKMSMVERSDADIVLLMDSDVVLTKPVDASTFRTDGKPSFSRIEGAIHDGMRRHILWHKAARKMLGLSNDVSPPLNDYVDSFNIWSPDVVRALCSRISEKCGKAWQTAFAANLHASEFILYGVFIDEVLGASAPVWAVNHMPCHNYWDEVPLDLDAALSFVDRARDDDVALMISAKSRTELSIRRQAIARAQGL